MPKPASEPATTHIIQASLKPRLYRDVEITSTASLHKLAEAIIDAYRIQLRSCVRFFQQIHWEHISITS